jgi:2-iminobutanoate/2-iminopropanoate deaminase
MKQCIRTAHAPAAIGPYSQAVVVPVGEGKRMIFCSGQIALVPETGMLLEGDVAAQARQALENLGAVLAAAGASYGDVVRTTIFLADMNDFAAVNAVYGERFPYDPPARSTVAAAGLPRGALVEIDAIAII